MALAKAATRGIELEPIDRLEEKLKLLVAMVEKLKSDQSRVMDENQRLTRELDGIRARLAAQEAIAAELSTLREERDVIRTRVGDMLEQLDSLNL
jgi:regulator of replication initiation timing